MRDVKIFLCVSTLVLLVLCLGLWKASGDVYFLGWAAWAGVCLGVALCLPAGHDRQPGSRN